MLQSMRLTPETDDYAMRFVGHSSDLNLQGLAIFQVCCAK